MKLNFIKNLASVPEHCYVIRLTRPPKDFHEKKKISSIQLDSDGVFTPSTADRESTPPHLSVWVDFLTTPVQAYRFLQGTNPNSDKKLVLRLSVSEIRNIVGIVEGKTYPNLLNVVWVFLEESVRNKLPGARGHSGITGGLFEQLLPNELTKEQKKNLRKYLRSELAKLASNDCFLLKEGQLLPEKSNKQT